MGWWWALSAHGGEQGRQERERSGKTGNSLPFLFLTFPHSHFNRLPVALPCPAQGWPFCHEMLLSSQTPSLFSCWGGGKDKGTRLSHWVERKNQRSPLNVSTGFLYTFQQQDVVFVWYGRNFYLVHLLEDKYCNYHSNNISCNKYSLTNGC